MGHFCPSEPPLEVVDPFGATNVIRRSQKCGCILLPVHFTGERRPEVGGAVVDGAQDSLPVIVQHVPAEEDRRHFRDGANEGRQVQHAIVGRPQSGQESGDQFLSRQVGEDGLHGLVAIHPVLGRRIYFSRPTRLSSQG